MSFSNAISEFRVPFKRNRAVQIMIILFSILWGITLSHTTDLANWILENALVFVFIGYLSWSWRKHQYSDVSYLLIFIYLCLHVYGAMYTYAENPFGYWLMDTFDLARNHYDRIVHFSFGFLLAYPMRELFIIHLGFAKWVGWALPIEVTLSISALYELIEWGVADVFFKEQGAAYLGTQGDIWDAQKDIALATLGAILATTIVSLIKRSLKIY